MIKKKNFIIINQSFSIATAVKQAPITKTSSSGGGFFSRMKAKFTNESDDPMQRAAKKGFFLKKF